MDFTSCLWVCETCLGLGCLGGRGVRLDEPGQGVLGIRIVCELQWRVSGVGGKGRPRKEALILGHEGPEYLMGLLLSYTTPW